MNAKSKQTTSVWMQTGEISVHDALNADNLFEAIGSRDALVEASGALKSLAVSLIKIAGDIRLPASGPRTGIGAISLPGSQPGRRKPAIEQPLIQHLSKITCGKRSYRPIVAERNHHYFRNGGQPDHRDWTAMRPPSAHPHVHNLSPFTLPQRQV